MPTEKQLLDRKQQSMAAGVISGYDEALNSPLNMKEKNMAHRQNTLRGYDIINNTPLQGPGKDALRGMNRENKIASDFSQ